MIESIVYYYYTSDLLLVKTLSQSQPIRLLRSIVGCPLSHRILWVNNDNWIQMSNLPETGSLLVTIMNPHKYTRILHNPIKPYKSWTNW